MSALTHDTTGRTSSGLGFAVLSASSFALSGPLASGLLSAGWSAAAAVAVRVLIAAVVIVPFAVVAVRGRWALVRRNLPLIVAYGVIPVAGTQLAYFNAVAYMPVGVALLIEFTSPVAVVGWLWLRYSQRPTWLTVLGAVLAIIGLLLVLDVVSGMQANVIGVAWALVAMIGGAVYFVLSSRPTGGLPGVVLAAGGMLVGGITLLLAGAVGIVPFVVSGAPVAFSGFSVPWWAPVLTLGVVTAGIAYVAGIAAARRLGSRLASFVGLMEVVMTLVFAWLLLAQAPRLIQVAGGVLVLAGVVAVKLGERRVAPAAQVEPVAAV